MTIPTVSEKCLKFHLISQWTLPLNVKTEKFLQSPRAPTSLPPWGCLFAQVESPLPPGFDPHPNKYLIMTFLPQERYCPITKNVGLH